MTGLDIKRIEWCAKALKAFGMSLTILADHRIRYQVGALLVCDNIDELEAYVEVKLQSRSRASLASLRLPRKLRT